MSEHTPITGELRDLILRSPHEQFDCHPPVVRASMDERKMLTICDAIDAVHAQLERENDALKESAEQDRDGWVRLPLDADGEYIHVGDVMENIVCPSVHREVTGVGVECFYGWDDGNGRYSQFAATCYRHHHVPTVEDVLTEFSCVLMGKREFDGDVTEAIAEYAAKLRLAGDAE